MNYQQGKTFDAGVIASHGFGAPGAQMTLDEAGIASGGAFLVSELEKRDTTIRKPLTSFTYPRDIVIKTGGGWVDYLSALSVSYGVTGGSESGPVAAGGANGLPTVQANLDKGVWKAHPFAVALRVMFIDMQKANFIGRSLDSLLQDGVRLTYDKHMDANVYVGLADYGTTGLVNNPEVTETTVANGAKGTAAWATKTADEILADINSAISAVWESAEHDMMAIPNHILLPYEQYLYIMNTKVTDLATDSIMDYVMKNNIAAKLGGSELFIGATAYCKGAGTGSTDRMVVYVNQERYLQMEELVPLTRAMSQPNVSQFAYDTAYAANISEVELMAPQTMGYFDGI